MKTKVYNMKRSVITISCILFSIGVMAQAHSSGGGSETGYKSTLGNQNTANGNYSLAAGWGNQANGQTSFALGYYSTAQGLNSMALGMYTKSQAAYGITIGKGYNNNKPLTNNTGGIMFGAGSNVPTLFISPENTENRTGKVAIGNVTSPLAKLHVAADANEDASILLASTGTLNVTGDVSFGNLAGNTTKIVTVGTDGKLNAKSGRVYALCD